MALPLEELLNRFDGVKPCRDGYTARCPAHDDKRPSLKIKESNGRILFYCYSGCAVEQIIQAAGLSWDDIMPDKDQWEKPQSRIDAIYKYCNADGKPLYEVVRYYPKRFLQRKVLPDGKYEYGISGVPRVLYRLPELLAHKKTRPNDAVWFVEGEKDVETLCRYNLTATCIAGGCKSPWEQQFTEALTGLKHLVIVPDADKSGREFAYRVAGELIGAVENIWLLDLWPQRTDGADISDWLTGPEKLDELRALFKKRRASKINKIAESND